MEWKALANKIAHGDYLPGTYYFRRCLVCGYIGFYPVERNQMKIMQGIETVQYFRYRCAKCGSLYKEIATITLEVRGHD